MPQSVEAQKNVHIDPQQGKIILDMLPVLSEQAIPYPFLFSQSGIRAKSLHLLLEHLKEANVISCVNPDERLENRRYFKLDSIRAHSTF